MIIIIVVDNPRRLLPSFATSLTMKYLYIYATSLLFLSRNKINF